VREADVQEVPVPEKIGDSAKVSFLEGRTTDTGRKRQPPDICDADVCDHDSSLHELDGLAYAIHRTQAFGNESYLT